MSLPRGCLQSILLLLLFFAIGAVIMFFGWRTVANAQASASWPSVPGQVISSTVTRQSDSDGSVSFSPEVSYRYQVGSQSYQGRRIKFGENAYGFRARAQSVADRYPVGHSVSVYYDPADPNLSVLEPGVSLGSYIVVCIGAVFVFFSLLAIPVTLVMRRREAASGGMGS